MVFHWCFDFYEKNECECIGVMRILLVIISLLQFSCRDNPVREDNITEYQGDYIYDENGIIMKWYDDDYYYNPVLISGKAFYTWNANIFGYFTDLLNIDGFGEIVDDVFSIELIDNETAKDTFLIYADWYASNYSQITNDAIVWKYEFDYFPYLQEAPWVSSMAQGAAIRVFIRAFLLTNNEYYLELAKKAVNSYMIEYEDGGIRQYDGEGNVYYEEYPGNPTSHVLNGFIFAIWGLYEHWIVTGDDVCYSLFQEGVKTLKNRLPDYDMGDNSKYDLIRFGQTFRFTKIIEDIIDTIYVTSSNNPEDYGPNNLIDGNHSTYWASVQFPSTIRIELKYKQIIDSLIIYGFSQTSVPKDLTIKLKEDDIEIFTFELTANTEKDIHLDLLSKTADEIIIEIFNDNGNENVAIREIELLTRSKPLPVDSLYFYANGDISKARTIDVGGEDIEGDTGNHSRINYIETEMWSDKDIIDCRSLRYFDTKKASYCSINFLIPENCNYPGNYSLKIVFKDVSLEKYNVEIYDGRQYQNIGTIIGESSNLWVNNVFNFNEALIRGREASISYNELHARQLLYTFKITGEAIFKEYSDLFYSYNN